MTKESIAYPPLKRPYSLMQEIVLLLQPLSFVHQIHIFGSLTGDKWDRWSDIDLLIVTETQQHYWTVWETIHRHKPILHHHPLSLAEPIGYHMLGNIFVGESVFHCLDLNLMTIHDIREPHTLDRFVNSVQLYSDNSIYPLSPDGKDTIKPQVLTSDEDEIATAIHFTKKSIKTKLRGGENDDTLVQWNHRLTRLMQHYSFDYQTVGGHIGKVAETYQSIADDLLNT